jgi:hypothetical protein
MKRILLLAVLGSSAAAAADFTLGPKSLSYGVGIRVGGGFANQSPDESIGVQTLDVRPYIGAQIAPWLKFSGNLDLNNGDGGRIHVLDAIAQFEPTELLNVWLGRFLPPSDRANLSGPYYQNAWNYPTTVNGYPSIYAGRADGAALWGQIGGGKFKYQGGVFTLDSTTPAAQAIYAGRLVFNVLDPEPGYYNSSTYYGSKDILALGGALQYKKTVDPATAVDRKFVGFNLDLLFEKKLPTADVLTLEGAYYDFDEGNVVARQGWSAYGLASWLFAAKLGPGRVQPMARYQYAAPTGVGAAAHTIDAGLNYILEGHNARAGLVVQNTSQGSGSNYTGIQLGIQIQE